MKSKTTKILALTAVLCGLHLSAATPVAVWEGDFKTTVKGNYTLYPNGNTVAEDGSTITIGVKGVKVWTNPVTEKSSGMTVLYRYSGMTFDKQQALVGFYAAGNGTYVGVELQKSNVSKGLYADKEWSGETGASFTTGSGVIAATYSHTGGTYCYYLANNTRTQIYGSSSLKAKDQHPKGVNVGGMHDETVKGAVGAKISAIAVFEGVLSEADMTAFRFPTELNKMYNNRLSTGNVVVPAGTYGAITVPGAGYKATAFASKATLGSASGEEITGSYADIIKNGTDTATHTFAGWFMIGSLPASGSTTMIYHARSQATTANDNGYMVAVTSGGEIKVGKTHQTSFADGLVSTGASIVGGKWFHVAVSVTKSASARTATPVVYVNGNKVTMASGTFATNLGGNGCVGVDIGTGVSAAGIYVDNTALYDSRAVVKGATNYVVQASFVATVTTSANWSDLNWSPSVPTAGADVKLINNGADGVTAITLADSVSVGKLTVESAAGKELKIANFATKMTATSYDFSKAPGGVGLDVSTGYTVEGENPLRRYIRDNNVKVKFYGSGEKGVSIVNGYDLNKAIQGHWIFEGGKHSMKYGNSIAGGSAFGANASLDNPTILVKSGTTLDFTGKDLSYWSGAADMNGVIKVEDGGRINMKDDSSTVDGGTVYYRQRIALNPGAEFYIDMAANNFRLQGGTESGKEQLYVPEGSGTAYIKPTDASRDSIYLAKDTTRGFGVFVGAGSTLDIQTKLACQEDSSNQNNFEIAKHGTGTLKLSGDISGYWNQGYDKVVKFSMYAGDMELAMAQAVKCQIWFQSGTNLKLTGDGTVVSGYLDGPGKVVCNSTGTVTISRAENTYSGGTVIQSGTLKIGGAASLGTGTVSFAGGTLDLNGQTLTGKTISGSGTVINSSNTAASINGVSVAAGKSYTITEGKFSIIVSEGETLTLTSISAANTLKIGGAGRVEYTNAAIPTLPTGLWAEDWTGTFAYSGCDTNIENWDPTSYYNGTKSKFEFGGKITYNNGATSLTTKKSYFREADFSLGELILKSGSYIGFNNGYTSWSGRVNNYCFTKLSGSGSLVIDSTTTTSCGLKFSDVSEFAGTISNTSSNEKGGYRIIMGDGAMRAEGNDPTKAAIHFTGNVTLSSFTLSAKNGVEMTNDVSLVFADAGSKLTVNSSVVVNSGKTIPVKIADVTDLTAGKELITWTSQPAGSFSLMASGVAAGQTGFKASKNDTNLTAIADTTKTYYEVEGGETTTTFDNTWLTAAGVTGSTTDEVQEKLDTPNANGIKPSDAYLMGYEAKDAQNAAVILKPNQAQSNGETISLSVAGVPNETRNGAVITYTAQASASRDWENPSVEEEMGATGSVSMALPTSGVLYYRVQATVALP